ncbi:MAG: substrate-binding domain-containing protein [Planctomycetota bacterium]|jgi:DNA-binding LacI/PurR family transcriptional regulator
MGTGPAVTESKHPAIRDEVRRRICRGEIGEQLPSIRSLADDFGVHSITVTKAVDALVKEGLVRSVPRKGYFVVRRRVRTVLMLVYAPSLGPGFYGELARILTAAMPRFHLRHEILLKGSGENGEDFPAADRLPAAKGTAVLTVGVQDRAYILSLMEAGFPTVALDYVPTDPAISAVGVDNIAAASEATRRLIDLGCRNVVYMGHKRGARTEVDALLLEVGYRIAMEEAGLEPRSCFAGNTDAESGADALVRALDEGPAPEAVFCSNPSMVPGIARYCETRGLEVPREVVTLDFLREYPELTTVRIDMERFCTTALELLRETSSAAGKGPRQVLVPARLEKPGGSAARRGR